MNTPRSFLSLCSVILVLFASAQARAEILTATFTGIATGYENLPAAPNDTTFVDNNATGTMLFDPSLISFNGFYFSGPGVELTFNVMGRTVVRGGIGDNPDTMPDGSFWDHSTSTQQRVSFVGGNGGCGGLCSGGLALSGPLGAFGPDGLTPQNFHPGPVFFDGSSVASFGDRDFGATISLTSIQFTPNGSVGAIPEPSTYATMLVGLALLGYAFRQSKRSAAIKP